MHETYIGWSGQVINLYRGEEDFLIKYLHEILKEMLQEIQKLGHNLWFAFFFFFFFQFYTNVGLNLSYL